jgi:hypothetical protein
MITSLALFIHMMSAIATPAWAQCGGCALDFVNAFYTAQRSFYFDSSIGPGSALRGATNTAMQNWNNAGSQINGWTGNFTAGEGGVVKITIDSDTPGAMQWCYPGSACDSNNGWGTLRIHPSVELLYSHNDRVHAMAHELGHTLGWGDEAGDCTNTIMNNQPSGYSILGPTSRDICWFNGGEEPPCDIEPEYCLPVSKGPRIELRPKAPALPIIRTPPGRGGRGGGGGNYRTTFGVIL